MIFLRVLGNIKTSILYKNSSFKISFKETKIEYYENSVSVTVSCNPWCMEQFLDRTNEYFFYIFWEWSHANHTHSFTLFYKKYLIFMLDKIILEQ